MVGVLMNRDIKHTAVEPTKKEVYSAIKERGWRITNPGGVTLYVKYNYRGGEWRRGCQEWLSVCWRVRSPYYYYGAPSNWELSWPLIRAEFEYWTANGEPDLDNIHLTSYETVDDFYKPLYALNAHWGREAIVPICHS